MSHSSQAQGESTTRRLDMLLDVPLDVSVELGRCRMTIQDLLALGPGSERWTRHRPRWRLEHRTPSPCEGEGGPLGALARLVAG